MGVSISLKANEIWKFYKDNPKRLAQEQVVVAENTDTKYEICATEHLGHLQLIVYRKDVRQYEELVIDEQDCERTAKQLYVKYLLPVTVESKEPGDSGKKIPVDSKKQTSTKTPKASQRTGYVPDVPDNLDQMDDNDIAELVAELDDEIYQREDELELATKDFLSVLLNCDTDKINELYGRYTVVDFLDHVCEHLAEDMLISIYRPTWVPDEETGVDMYVKYPYLEVDEEYESSTGDLADVE